MLAAGDSLHLGGTTGSVPFRSDGYLTICCWAYPYSFASIHPIFSITFGNYYVSTHWSGSEGYLGGESYVGPWSFAGAPGLPPLAIANRWNHIASIMEPTGWTHAVNGTLGTKTTSTSWTCSGWDRFSVGSMWYAAGEPWYNTCTAMAGVSVFNEALSADKIKALAAGAPPDKVGNLVEHWPLIASRGPAVGTRRKLMLTGKAGPFTGPTDPRVVGYP